MIQRYEWEQTVTKLKKVQKENYMLRGQIDMLQREADYWEHQAKYLDRTCTKLEKNTMQLEAQLKLWKGTAP
jgi:peptidoglycan hydrolase CwlO-like protein